MTLPLQPMTTAPRDGSWIWAVFSQSMVRVRWDDSNQSWRSAPGFEYEDEEYLGWLDLAALVRDSDRLKEEARSHRSAIRHALQFLRDPSGCGDGHKDECIAACEKCLLTDRAAIDKESSRG